MPVFRGCSTPSCGRRRSEWAEAAAFGDDASAQCLSHGACENQKIAGGDEVDRPRVHARDQAGAEKHLRSRDEAQDQGLHSARNQSIPFYRLQTTVEAASALSDGGQDENSSNGNSCCR